MPNIVEDARQALTKLDEIQIEFEEENRRISEFINNNKQTIDGFKNVYESFEERVNQYLSQLSKINAAIKTYNDIQNNAVEEISSQLEIKTKNNIQIAQNNLNVINEQLNEYVISFQNSITNAVDNCFDEKMNSFIVEIDSKLEQVKKINENVNRLIDEQNKKNNKRLPIIIIVLLAVLIIIGIINIAL